MNEKNIQSVAVVGQTISYCEAGQGPSLVLLHGFLCDARVWRPQLSGLSDQFRVVAWDAPGAGASSDPSEPFTTENYAQCLAAFLNAIGVENAHILGLSWGGILAQTFYGLYRQRVRSLFSRIPMLAGEDHSPKQYAMNGCAPAFRTAVARLMR
jgi:pimeloyl-ACP methyl ester carboxylesterase